MPSLLIVTAAFAPSRRIGARRPERMAAWLSLHGWQVTVLTLHPPYMRPLDPDLRPGATFEVLATHAAMPRVLLEAWREHARTTAPRPAAATAPHPRPTGWHRRLADAAPRVLGRARPLLNKAMACAEFPDMWRGWQPFAERAVRGRRFDVVLGTLPPFSTGPIARAVARQTGARLVLDYRDPWSENLPLSVPAVHWPGFDLYARHRALEDACLAEASLVLGVTPTICAWLRARSRCEVALITNGCALPDPAARPATPGPTQRLVYAGSLAYDRDLTPILRALAVLGQDREPVDLRLAYAGPHSAMVQAAARKHGVADRVDDAGELPAARALELLDDALAGVVLVPEGVEYGYPGKLFEILGRNRPILLLARPTSDAAALVARHRLGWTHEPSDLAGLVATLRAAHAGAVPLPVDLDELGNDRLMARLAELLARLVG